MTKLSPGRAQAAFHLVEIVANQLLSSREIHRAFGSFAAIPSHEVVEFVKTIGWVEEDDASMLEVTPAGQAILAITTYPARLRQALRDYARVLSPPWLMNAAFGRSRVLRFIDPQLAQVFSEADLSSGTDSEAVRFWDEWANAARQQNATERLDVGRRGEELTVHYEMTRTQRSPQWIALDNSTVGYDVLSVSESSSRIPLPIEVKTTRYGLQGSCHITRNEWEFAQQAKVFVFHLWQLKDSEPPLLARVCVDGIAAHVPLDRGVGQWETVEIPFGAFEGLFEEFHGANVESSRANLA